MPQDARNLPTGTLEEQLHKLLQAVEQSPSTVMITDKEGNVDYVNPKFYRITGRTPEEVLGKNVRLLKLGDQPPELYQELWATLRAGGEWRGRFHNLRKDGSAYWESVSLAPLRDINGATTHYIKVAEDITKLVDLENWRADLNRMVEHDLKNPLTGIVSAVELFLEGLLGSVTEEQRKYLEIIKISSRKLTNLIYSILNVDKFEAGKMEVRKTVFSMEELVKELSWFESLAKSEAKQIVIQIEKGLRLNADRDLIVRILENLVSNALKHTPSQGTVRLIIRKDGDQALFEVIDNGEGIPGEYLGRIFEKFFMVEQQSLKTKFDTGLGLAFCKMAVEAQGGTIKVESQPGKGSRFYFRLPAA
ncbi:PAS domain S-box protein [Candidatus Saganbacteria bacterium]|nr:PAS domain S-box protein [Candidatus Saganbacteria bacterium]